MDWIAIKGEYVAGGVTYASLADKYGIPRSVIERRGREQGWKELRKRAELEGEGAQLCLADSIRERSARIDEKYLSLLETLISRAQSLIDATPDWHPTGIKEMATALKYIKECKSIRTDADAREQEARISKLLREAREEAISEKNTVEVILDAGPHEWNE